MILKMVTLVAMTTHESKFGLSKPEITKLLFSFRYFMCDLEPETLKSWRNKSQIRTHDWPFAHTHSDTHYDDDDT